MANSKKVFSKDSAAMILNGPIGRRLLNVRRLPNTWDWKWTPSTERPGCGRFPASRSVERCGSMWKLLSNSSRSTQSTPLT